MRVQLRVIGELKRKARVVSGELELDAEANVDGLLEHLGLEHKDLVIMRNGRRASRREALQDGDELVVVPVAVGG
ncbi:MAG: MoaD/ThiS family protein [Solirubrobacterales bacterium]